MFWIVMAAATQMSLPVSIDPKVPDFRLVYRADDFPYSESLSGKAFFVQIEVTVRPDASIQSCTIKVSSTNPKIDARACEILRQRAKMAPAKWSDGRPSYAVFRLPIRWVSNVNGLADITKLPRVTRADLEITVNALPKTTTVNNVQLVVAADSEGKLVDCVENPSMLKSPYRPAPQLVPIACRQVLKDLKLAPPKDPYGLPVRSVQTVSVEFVAE